MLLSLAHFRLICQATALNVLLERWLRKPSNELLQPLMGVDFVAPYSSRENCSHTREGALQAGRHSVPTDASDLNSWLSSRVANLSNTTRLIFVDACITQILGRALIRQNVKLKLAIFHANIIKIKYLILCNYSEKKSVQ